MLSPADAAIVERDRRLPGLRTLLDPDAFCESLRRISHTPDIRSARPRYVRYKPGTSCLVAYDVTVGDRTVGAYARCHAGDQLVKVSNARLRVEVTGPLGHGLLADLEAGIAVFAYPNDYEIKTLRKLFEGERTPRRLRRMLPAHLHLQHATPTVLRYKPERRFVGKLEADGGPPAVLRLYPEHTFAEMREKAWAFKCADGLHIPRIVGDSERYAAIAHEWVEGETPTAETLGGDDNLLAGIAHALAAMHRQRPRLSTMYSVSDYCRGVTGACQALDALGEELGRRAARQWDLVREHITERPWRPRAVHGDFTADQVLILGNRTTILDFDRAGYGDAAMDLGAFSAGLINRAVTGEITIGLAIETAARFVEAYRHENGPADPAGVRACTAGALLMTAPEPFRHRVEDWPAATVALLDSVDRVLAGETVDA
ncbi:MAG TPA: aminoglycoside phosphotransferase family protein [Phycisphaerales bacterium]|nr:aminoglycoside phosphotransferase family protein [Phycisphaerales bacterium]